MKRKSSLILLIALLLFSGENISAQSWLKKAAKAIDKAGRDIDKQMKKIDEALQEPATESTANNSTGTEAAASAPSTGWSEGQDYSGVKIKSFHSQIDIILESCIKDGSTVTITYLMKNRGPVLNFTNLGTPKTIINPDDETTIIDNLSNSYTIKYQTFGTDYGSRVGGSIPEGISKRGTIEIEGVKPNAKSFALVNMAGLLSGGTKSVPFSFSFRNLPIYTPEDLQRSAKVIEKIVKPYVEKQMSPDVVIDAITITDRNTKVDLTWTNNKYNSYGYIFLENPEKNWIEVNGKRYELIRFNGIGKRNGEWRVDYKKSVSYSLIFEKIPQGVTPFNIYHEGWDFIGVRAKAPASVSTANTVASTSATATTDLNIPKVKGVMSLRDNYNQHDKRTRITQADRLALKINMIKGSDFDTKWTNKQLSKGKLIYQGKEGKLQTILFIENDHASAEYLVSYDAKGNYVDCIRIGFIHAYGGDRGETTIQGNQVNAHFSAEGSLYRTYKITPQLKFVLLKEWEEEPNY